MVWLAYGSWKSMFDALLKLKDWSQALSILFSSVFCDTGRTENSSLRYEVAGGLVSLC